MRPLPSDAKTGETPNPSSGYLTSWTLDSPVKMGKLMTTHPTASDPSGKRAAGLDAARVESAMAAGATLRRTREVVHRWRRDLRLLAAPRACK